LFPNFKQPFLKIEYTSTSTERGIKHHPFFFISGNIMVFLVIAMNRSMHSATNVLLLNLSLSDILFVAFSVPGLLAIEICNGRWPFTEAKAKMMQQTTILVAASSVFTMMAIAFERYRREKCMVVIYLIFNPR
jgi:hypothetical protein